MRGTSKYLRGAFVQYTDTFLVPTPKIITFQFNPETMTHTWQPAKSETGTPGQPADPLAITGSPEETFSFTLAMDANDMIEAGGASEQLAAASGVYSRLAALEMLLFPTSPVGAGLVGTVSVNAGPGGSISLSAGLSIQPTRPVSAAQLPMVLFVWGPGRVVPVRVAQLTITEKLYDSDLLNPTHAEAQIQLRVLTPEELRFVEGPLGAVGTAAQLKSDNLRRNRAGDNLANAVESVIGVLPL
jgi:hypothetical protein